MNKKSKVTGNDKEPLRLFKYTPGIVLSLGAAVVAAAAFLDKPVDRTPITYPAPVEEQKKEEVAEAPATKVIVTTPDPEPIPVPEVKPTEPAPEVQIVEPKETVPAETSSVPEVESESRVEEVPKIEEQKQVEKIEVPTVAVESESSAIVVAKPTKYKKCKPKKDESVKDIFTENFMRGNGF